MDWNKGWLILLIGLLLSGCATTEEVEILRSEIYKFHSEINTLQKEREQIQKGLEALNKESVNLQKENTAIKADLVTESSKIQADLILRFETLQSEIRNISTGLEEYKEFLKRPSKEIDRVKEDMALRIRLLEEKGRAFEGGNKSQEDRIKSLEENIKSLEGKIDRTRLLEENIKSLEVKIDQIVSKQIGAKKSTSAKEASIEMREAPMKAGNLYKDAYETFRRGNLDGARRKFEAFLKQYPNSDLSDNAQFWIGETYYLKKDFEKAILEYEKAIAKYPEGDKIPAALFKQALAFLELGDKTNARSLLKRVIERYPNSEQAEMAKKRLERIK